MLKTCGKFKLEGQRASSSTLLLTGRILSLSTLNHFCVDMVWKVPSVKSAKDFFFFFKHKPNFQTVLTGKCFSPNTAIDQMMMSCEKTSQHEDFVRTDQWSCTPQVMLSLSFVWKQIYENLNINSERIFSINSSLIGSYPGGKVNGGQVKHSQSHFHFQSLD